jgi:hypothetical protein
MRIYQIMISNEIEIIIRHTSMEETGSGSVWLIG